MADDDEPEVVRLADFRRVPSIGDPSYDRALDCKPGDVRDLTHTKAKALIDAAVTDGVALDWILREVQARQRQCGHQKTALDRKRRLVRCVDCGENVDVFDMVAAWAEGSIRGYHEIVNRDNLVSETARLQRNLDALRAEEKRLKARAAAAKKARKSALRLSDPDVRELGLWRDLYDARADHDFQELRRLGPILAKINDERRASEPDVEPEPDVAAPVNLREAAPDG